MPTDQKFAKARDAWRNVPPGRFVKRGHPIGDFLEAHEWRLLEEQKGYVRVDAHLPKHVRNPGEQLFGGFTPTYVDFVSLFAVHAGGDRSKGWNYWLATTGMRVEYFEPVTGLRFIVESRLTKERGRTCFVETRFFDPAGRLSVFATVTLRKRPIPSELLGTQRS